MHVGIFFCQWLIKGFDFCQHDEIAKPVGQETEFIFLRLNVLREYLERELKMDNLPFTYEFEVL